MSPTPDTIEKLRVLNDLDLGALAAYRGLPGWSLRPDTNGISWLKVPTGDEEIFRKLPLLGRWTSDTSGKLTREGKSVPEAMLPDDGWQPLATMLPVAPPPRGAPGMPPPAVGFRLETDDAGHPAADDPGLALAKLFQ